MSGSELGAALHRHVRRTTAALGAVEGELERIERWGRHLGAVLARGGRLLAVGNGGSAAQAQHLTAELSGRYLAERRPLSAIPLHGDTSALTAIGNDYGPDLAFARQVEAHGRPGDVLVALSTSGRSQNVIVAARTAAAVGMHALALTGPAPNPLAAVCADAVAVPGPAAAVQEGHLVAIHLLCAVVDHVVGSPAAEARR